MQKLKNMAISVFRMNIQCSEYSVSGLKTKDPAHKYNPISLKKVNIRLYLAGYLDLTIMLTEYQVLGQ